ncbi:hypothetical protein CN271_20715 [Bacillus cereus]|nr:hypothetical protein CON59_23940 [Bacillus cereus]PET44602.1 hypothetical protein CN523_18700 [Bacillus cereus]PFA59170.1 hypothetical protein CN389_04660 [Bacillus cereus]PFD67583.1 hypothetical protein CN271_20715 [Bacillus cereus]PFE70002.1 hypothetical protein CN319_22280 [Bacillus cereus]
MPSSDLNHFNFNNMYWTPIQIVFYHVKLFYTLRKNKSTLSSAQLLFQLQCDFFSCHTTTSF